MCWCRCGAARFRARHGWWEVILEPGRVWNERGDHGMTRAAIPFSLQEKNANCTHNGVLMFLFGADGSISRTAMQIASETCLYLHARSVGAARHALSTRCAGRQGRRASGVRRRTVRRACRVATLGQLRADHPELDVDALAIGAADASTLHGLVVGGVNYHRIARRATVAIRTAMSSICRPIHWRNRCSPATALMRLQSSWPQTRRAADCRARARMPGAAWDGVTFLQTRSTWRPAISIRSRSRPTKMPPAPRDCSCRSITPARSASAATVYPHGAVPGTQWVYHSSDTYILGTALAHYPAKPSGTSAGRSLFAISSTRRSSHRST